MIKPLCIMAAFITAPLTHADDKADIATAFRAYKEAIVAKKGGEAVGLVTKATLDDYQRYVDLAREADRAAVEALPVPTRVQVLMIRHRVDAASLRKFAGDSMFAHAVEQDWTGSAGVNRMDLGEITVKDETATGKVMVGGQAVGMDFSFKKENGKWRIDLAALTKSQDSTTMIQATAARAGMEENAFILHMLEQTSGKKPDESIWTAPGKGE